MNTSTEKAPCHKLTKGQVTFEFFHHNSGNRFEFITVEKVVKGETVELYGRTSVRNARTWYANLMKMGYRK